MYHVIESALAGKPNRLSWRGFVFLPKSNIYYVAAEETMKSGFLPKLFQYGGAITVQRTWREAGQEIQRAVNLKDTSNIQKALNDGWVITFPQGTTKPFVQGRKGTAHIILEERPIVVPVVIDGLRRAFDKKGLLIKKRGGTIRITFKSPLGINFSDGPEDLMHHIMDSIEQSEDYNLVED